MNERYRLFFYIRQIKRRVDTFVYAHYAIFNKSNDKLVSNREYARKIDAVNAANILADAFETELEKVILGEK